MGKSIVFGIKFTSGSFGCKTRRSCVYNKSAEKQHKTNPIKNGVATSVSPAYNTTSTINKLSSHQFTCLLQWNCWNFPGFLQFYCAHNFEFRILTRSHLWSAPVTSLFLTFLSGVLMTRCDHDSDWSLNSTNFDDDCKWPIMCQCDQSWSRQSPKNW